MPVHVFSAGPTCSLRKALLVWLLPVFLLVGAGSAGLSYWTYNRMVSTFMDNQMTVLAESLAAQDEPLALQMPSEERVREWGTYVVQVYSPSGGLQASSWPQLSVGLQEVAGFADVQAVGSSWRVYTAPPGNSKTGQRVQVVQSGEFRSHLAASRAWGSVTPLLILLPLSAFILWCVAAVASRELKDLTSQVAAQDENSIKELSLTRVPAEIAPLVVAFNSLLTRLRDAFTNQRHFVQDAAHELRTPMAAISLQLENMRGDAPCQASTERFGQLEAGVQRAQRLVDQMLKLSRQQALATDTQSVAANLPDVTAADVNVNDLVHQSISGLIVLADQRNIDLGVCEALAPQGTATQRATVRCPPADLRSALDNLIDNALRYTPAGGVVDVQVKNEAGRVAIEVTDTGPGIPPHLMDRVFDRFFRVPGGDQTGGAQNSNSIGSGLGLAIAQAAAQRCGMRIALRNRSDRPGLVARLEAQAV